MFDQYKPYSDAALKRVWQDGLIVLDANILLHLYRVDDTLRTAVFGILEDEKVAARLWFPYQAISEFYKNRPAVIAGQLRALEALERKMTEALSGLKELKDTPRFHIDREKWFALLKESEDRLGTFLRAAKASYPASMSSDPILNRVEHIITGKIGPRPDDTKLSLQFDKGKERLAAKIPPGYMDSEKGENGDYVVWEQCLEHCAQEKRALILVTDDNKEDWWHRTQGFTVGPRHELRAEFYQRVPGAEFVLVNFEDFVARISEQMTTRVEPDTVSDARQFAEFQRGINTEHDEEFDDAAQEAAQEAAIRRHRRNAPTKKRDARRNVDNMVQWFLERYEDPANGVPYDGREGGYQYVMGGPYDASDELQEEFDDGTPRMRRIIDEAVKRIENEGIEWVRVGEY